MNSTLRRILVALTVIGALMAGTAAAAQAKPLRAEFTYHDATILRAE